MIITVDPWTTMPTEKPKTDSHFLYLKSSKRIGYGRNFEDHRCQTWATFLENQDNFSGPKSCSMFAVFAFKIKVSIILKMMHWNYQLTKQNWLVCELGSLLLYSSHSLTRKGVSAGLALTLRTEIMSGAVYFWHCSKIQLLFLTILTYNLRLRS